MRDRLQSRRREDPLTIQEHGIQEQGLEEHGNKQVRSNRRPLTVLYLGLVAVATLGWVYAIGRGVMIIAEWLMG